MHRKFLFFVPMCLIFVLSVFFYVQSSEPILTHAQSTSTDWPMFGHDPTHSGVTDAIFNPRMGTAGCIIQSTWEVSPCMQPIFKKQLSQSAHGLSQPVVVGGTLFHATMDGKLLALDAGTGGQKWTFTADAPIGITPAVSGSTIFFGDFSGKIYALNTSNGSAVFPAIQTGGPIYSSPVVVIENGVTKVFIGSNDGKLYGINGNTGAFLFYPFDAQGAAIASNPAYYQGTVFFAAENMYAYAIDSQTGTQRWSKKLDGESNRGDHPIIIPATNLVLFHTVPRYGNSGMGLKDLFNVYRIQRGDALSDVLTQYQTSVQGMPQTKSLFLFSTSTGTEIQNFTAEGKSFSMLPMNIWYNNEQNYPVVLNQKDLVFGAFGGYLKLDTATKDISVLYRKQPLRGDEYTAITVADGWIYGAFTSNIARLKISDLSHEQLRGCLDCGDAYPFMDSTTGPVWQGYTGDGWTDAGGYVIIANGHAYVSIHGWLYAY